MEKPKPDIFAVLDAIDQRDGGWFARQSEADRNALAAPMYVRWASAVADSKQAEGVLLTLNALVNPYLFKFAGLHPELVFMLTAGCGAGTRQRHTWINKPRQHGSENAARTLLARFHPGASEAEIDLLMRLHTRASFAAFVADSAVDHVKDIMKDYDAYSKNRTKPAATPSTAGLD